MPEKVITFSGIKWHFSHATLNLYSGYGFAHEIGKLSHKARRGHAIVQGHNWE